MIKRARTALAIVATVALALLSSVATAEQGTIRIGLNNWPENIAVCNMWKLLFEEKGYEVELISAGKSVVYSGVADASVDIALEVWMPKTDERFYDAFAERIDLRDAWYRGTRLGLVVPSYVEVSSIAELNGNRALFARGGDPAIVGIDPGSALMGLTATAIEVYGLDFELIGSSGPGMAAALDRAISRHEPIVVTLWNPHWAFAEYELKYLQDPRGVYGLGENIHWMSRQGFTRDYPKAAHALSTWDMTDQQLSSLMAAVRQSDSPEEGVRRWMETHRELVDSWLAGW